MADVLEITVTETGESITVERDFTPEEIAQRVLDQANAEAAQQAADEEAAAKAAVRASALAKLAVLGLDEAEAEAIFGGA